jgi:rhodanese-related sulfurtransferase
MKRVDAAALKAWLHDGGEIALLDVREDGEFGTGHLFLAAPLPYSRFEAELERLVPRRPVRLVLVDDGASGVAARAAGRAEELGHDDVHVLAGGTRGWTAAGFRLFSGVNVPSKTFGEIVEHEMHVPSISAEELFAKQKARENLVIVDGRTVAEYRKMSIPGGIACPNGELVYRIGALAPDPETPIVVNCAGRTRSIMGAATLRRFGVKNRVVALRNGTMGWDLAGLELEHGAGRLYPAPPEGEALSALRRRAEAFAAEEGVPRLAPEEARAWLADPGRTAYVLDIRTEEEFAEGHVSGAGHAPGGQLVQATDQWLGVRRARVVLVDDTEIRAIPVAAWLRRMGWDAAVLRGGRESWARLGDVAGESRLEKTLPVLPRVANASGRPVLDVRSSKAYRGGHIEGARWLNRARVDRAAAGLSGECVLAASDAVLARLAARDLFERGLRPVGLLDGDGPEAWRAGGHAIVATPDDPPDAERIDHLFFTHDRHEGNRAAAQRYLDWELALVGQLDAQERAEFRV